MTIPSVLITTQPTRGTAGFWRFRTSDGARHATKSAFLASLATEYFEKQTRVFVDGCAGWYYRDVWQITPEAK